MQIVLLPVQIIGILLDHVVDAIQLEIHASVRLLENLLSVKQFALLVNQLLKLSSVFFDDDFGALTDEAEDGVLTGKVLLFFPQSL